MKKQPFVILFIAVLFVFFSSRIQTATGGNAIIYLNDRQQLITDWGYDTKWEWKGTLLTPSYAEEVFRDQKFSMLRVPVWGNLNKPAHPSDGVVIASEYENTITAMTNARNARPDVVLFASKKLQGQDSFPAWVKDANGVIPQAYARLLADFLEYMESEGFVIDVLGVDNELEYNEGNITPQKHKVIVDELQLLSIARGFNMPLIIAPETYGLSNANSWMNTLISNGWEDRYDIGGIHYYPQHRNLSKLQTFVNYTNGRLKWHSEVHWDNGGNAVGVVNEAEMALRIVFDCFDEGFSGMTWWGYPFSGLDGQIAQHLTTSTAKTRPVDMDDIDGRALTLGSLMTRAYIGDGDVRIWVINNSANVYSSYGFDLDSGTLTSPVQFTQWTETASTTGTAVTIDEDAFELDIPAYTATLIEFSVSVNELVAYYPFDNDVLDHSGNDYHGIVGGDEIYAAGVIDQALSFDGNDDYLKLENFSGISGTTGRTTSAWIKSDGFSSNAAIISWGANVAGQQWLFGTFSSGELLLYSGGRYINSNKTLFDDQWHHVAAVLVDDGSPTIDEVKLYIDGELQTDTYANSSYPIDTVLSENVLIGAYHSTPTFIAGYFDGLIDDARIYDYALDSYQMAELYLKTRPDERICFPQHNDLAFDYTGDCLVERADLLVLCSQWVSTYDMDDFAGLSSEWLLDSAMSRGDIMLPDSGENGDINALTTLADMTDLYTTINQWSKLSSVTDVYLEDRSDTFSNQIGTRTLCINPQSDSAYYNTNLEMSDFVGSEISLSVLVGQRWSSPAIGNYEIGTVTSDGAYTALQAGQYTTTGQTVLQSAPEIIYSVTDSDSGRMVVRLSQESAVLHVLILTVLH